MRLLSAGLVFVALGFLLGTGTIGFEGFLGTGARIVGWFAVIFFGLAAAVALFQVVTNRSYLLLTRDGFQMYGLRKSRLIPWSDVGSFVAVSLPNPMVMFDYRSGVKSVESRPQWARRLRSMNQGLTGHDAGLAETYGLRADELAAPMNSWRLRCAMS